MLITQDLTKCVPVYESSMSSYLWFNHGRPEERDYMPFAKNYPENLSFTKETMESFIQSGGSGIYLLCRTKVVGQTMFMSLYDRMNCIKEFPEEEQVFKDNKTLYVWNFSILPEFRNQGLAHILKSYFLFFAKRLGYEYVIGHTTLEMMRINRRFGAHLMKECNNYEGTDDTYFFYKIKL